MTTALTHAAGELAAALLARGWMLATAESCTGGLVAATLTDLAGSSAWFERGFVTYSNAAKMELLGVAADTLARHGAVSEATVAEMAQGVLARCPVQLSVAISGIAGPAGGSPDKPVGTVCFAWGRHGEVPHVETQHFSGDRLAIRQQATLHALRGLLALCRAA